MDTKIIFHQLSKNHMVLVAFYMLIVFITYWYLDQNHVFHMPKINLFQEGGWCRENYDSLLLECSLIPITDTWRTICFNLLLYITVGILLSWLLKLFPAFLGNTLFYIVILVSILLVPISSFRQSLDYSKMTIADCDKFLYQIKNNFKQEICYHRTLDYNKNPQLCWILPTNEKQHECYLVTARNLQDVHVCDQIYIERKRDECIDLFARAVEMKEKCHLIRNNLTKDECIKAVEYLHQLREEGMMTL